MSNLIIIPSRGGCRQFGSIKKLAEEINLCTIDNACHAPGCSLQDSINITQFCGNRNFAELAIFSFHPAKLITSVKGGIIITNEEEYYND